MAGPRLPPLSPEGRSEAVEGSPLSRALSERNESADVFAPTLASRPLGVLPATTRLLRKLSPRGPMLSYEPLVRSRRGVAMRRLSESLSLRATERCLLVYLVLYIVPEPFSPLFEAAWVMLVPWVGAQVLHLAAPIVVLPNGSGDTTFNYVHVLSTLVLAAAAALTWTLAQMRSAVSPHPGGRPHLRPLRPRHGPGELWVGEVLSPAIPRSECDPAHRDLRRLLAHGVAVGIHGLSTSYNVFAGVMELGSGLLLFFRRTTLLGAVAAATVLANIVMLNFSYDVGQARLAPLARAGGLSPRTGCTTAD
jgi:hypothetical protein